MGAESERMVSAESGSFESERVTAVRNDITLARDLAASPAACGSSRHERMNKHQSCAGLRDESRRVAPDRSGQWTSSSLSSPDSRNAPKARRASGDTARAVRSAGAYSPVALTCARARPSVRRLPRPRREIHRVRPRRRPGLPGSFPRSCAPAHESDRRGPRGSLRRTDPALSRLYRLSRLVPFSRDPRRRAGSRDPRRPRGRFR
jgi:hypothetical protein